MRHALITAGSKGLGRKVTEKLLEKGYSVTINYRNDKSGIEDLLTNFSHMQDKIHIVKGDVTKKEDIERMIKLTYERFGRIDFLISNAGPYIFERKKLVDYDETEWYEMMDGNLHSIFHFLKKTIPIMRNQQFGRIITYGFQGADSAPGWIYRSAYSAAKVGVVSLTKTVALEEAENGITANMVCPGNILGDMKEASIHESRLRKDSDTPIGRSGTGEDIARIIAFLCEDDSDMITGSVIEVTGGLDVINRFR